MFRMQSAGAALFAVVVFTVLAGSIPPRADDGAVKVLAAGSLRSAVNEIGPAFSNRTGVRVDSNFGPSGVLRGRIEKGEAADLFASADLANPLALSQAGKAGPVVLFARNRLCALVRPGLTVIAGNLLSTLLNPDIKLGTSTPKADPAGDYTWTMFAKTDAVAPGSKAILEAKAQQLFGGATSAAPPNRVDLYAWHIGQGHADIMLSYCSAGTDFSKALPGATVVHLPPELETAADYGLTLLPTKNDNAASLALFILSQEGQQILAKNGFDAPLLMRGP
jgi:ABC-type molybdate transport system substrate-binding protein